VIEATGGPLRTHAGAIATARTVRRLPRSNDRERLRGKAVFNQGALNAPNPAASHPDVATALRKDSGFERRFAMLEQGGAVMIPT